MDSTVNQFFTAFFDFGLLFVMTVSCFPLGLPAHVYDFFFFSPLSFTDYSLDLNRSCTSLPRRTEDAGTAVYSNCCHHHTVSHAQDPQLAFLPGCGHRSPFPAVHCPCPLDHRLHTHLTQLISHYVTVATLMLGEFILLKKQEKNL